uniref:Sosondowah ankyrin repeat domain family member B n=1 Tax=Laticauda laticaudata TaxID=8630 RepID=A0A8C5S767_LATLA
TDARAQVGSEAAGELSQAELLDFLCQAGGRVANAALLGHFQRFLRDPRADPAQLQHRRHLFKGFVNSVATVSQDGPGAATYVVLRKRYRDLIGEEPRSPPDHSPWPESPPRAPAGPSPPQPARWDRAGLAGKAPGAASPRGIPEPRRETGGQVAAGRRRKAGRCLPATPGVGSRPPPASSPAAPRGANRPGKGAAVQRPQFTRRRNGCRQRPGKDSGLDPYASCGKGARDGPGPSSPSDGVGSDQSFEFSSVPLDGREHTWLVKIATGSWMQVRALLHEDPHLVLHRDFVSGFTVLHWLAKHGNAEVLQDFVAGAREAGVVLDPNVRSGCGYTPFHPLVIKILVQRLHCRTQIRDSSGKKPWQYLNASASGEIWQLLGGPRGRTIFPAHPIARPSTAPPSSTSLARKVNRKPSLRIWILILTGGGENCFTRPMWKLGGFGVRPAKNAQGKFSGQPRNNPFRVRCRDAAL